MFCRCPTEVAFKCYRHQTINGNGFQNWYAKVVINFLRDKLFHFFFIIFAEIFLHCRPKAGRIGKKINII